jgi:hypothetical protein
MEDGERERKKTENGRDVADLSIVIQRRNVEGFYCPDSDMTTFLD